ncbi:MAG TPA: DUF192 domain-containing protein [Chthoniobacterales bacterium]
MQRTKPSSCQVPLALAIVILVAAALFCFFGALAIGIGAYYFIEAETGSVAVASPTSAASPTPAASPTVSSTPFAAHSPSVTPFVPSTPFRSTTPSTPPALSTRSAELDENGFHTAQIQIGTETLDVELAETPQQQAKGLRFRQALAENAGMLFLFPAPQRVSFWMKDASIPLSIAFIQSDGKIIQIRPMQPYDETPVPSLSDTVAYALLVNQGWFERHGISAGTVIEDLPR